MERSSTKTFNAGGVHILIDMKLAGEAVNSELLYILEEAVEKANATPIETCEKAFEPEGYTALILLEESHASLHYWPEEDYVAFDFFFCGEADYHEAINTITSSLLFDTVNIKIVDRKIP